MGRAPDPLADTLRKLGSVDWRVVILFVSALVPFWLLVDVMDEETIYAIALLGGILVCYIGWSYYVVEYEPRYRDLFAARALVVVLLGYRVTVIALG